MHIDVMSKKQLIVKQDTRLTPRYFPPRQKNHAKARFEHTTY